MSKNESGREKGESVKMECHQDAQKEIEMERGNEPEQKSDHRKTHSTIWANGDDDDDTIHVG